MDKRKPVRERQIPYDFPSMWTPMNKINKQMIETNSQTQTQLLEGRGVGALDGKSEGVKDKHKKNS